MIGRAVEALGWEHKLHIWHHAKGGVERGQQG